MTIVAHLRKNESGQVEEQTVKEHLMNVAEKMEVAAKPWGLGALAKLIGLLHDFSKSRSQLSGPQMSFQEYIQLSFFHPEKAARYRGKVDHSTGGAQFLWERYRSLNGEMVKKTLNLAGLSVMSHHGGLVNFLSGHGKSDYVRRLHKEDVKTKEEEDYFFKSVLSPVELDILFHQAVSEVTELDALIAKAGKHGGHDQDSENRIYGFYWGMVEKLLFSWLVDADRLDTAEFMGAVSLTQDWDYDALWNLFSKKLEDRIQTFALPAAGKARTIALARQDISNACLSFGQKEAGIYTLSVPTGSGKTLASMRFALAHAKKYHKKRIIVVIPYTSIIDQNAKEIRDVFQCDEAVLEHHSNVLPPDDMGEDEREWQKLLTERWDTPVIFTTQVQFLNTLFAGGCQSARRLQALTDSIIIFDEIQTLPVKCTYIFNEAMNFLKDFAGVTAVLCTATQPQLHQMAVPIHVDGEIVSELNSVFQAFQRVRLSYLKDSAYTAETLAPLLLQDAVERGSVLCIVNLTGQARNIFEAVSKLSDEEGDEIDIIHLSTKMCPAHRKREIDRMRASLTDIHNGKSKRKLICISTQLIEAGVDVSFTTVYRAMAGFASIAQAAGRCNRHGEIESGLVHIFRMEGERLDKLPDIQSGVKVATDLLHKMAVESILQPDNMELYFKRYYKDRGELEKAYRLPHCKNTLLDLLSMNDIGYQACADRGRAEELDILLDDVQAFADASQAFYVIDSATRGIVVPYGGGKDLITTLDGDLFNPKELRLLLKQAQQYTVNVFSYEAEALQRVGAIFKTQQGLLALREEYYDLAIGIQLATQANSFSCI